MRDLNILLPKQQLEDVCRRWKVAELSLFGSVLRDDFGPDSDIDVLVRFQPDSDWSLLDFARMKLELEALLGRPVDLVEPQALRNPFRRHTILSSKETVYAA